MKATINIPDELYRKVKAKSAAEVLATPGLATTKPGFVGRMIHTGYVRDAHRMLTFEKAAGKLERTRVLTS
jgi:hypothetical protein